MDKTTQRKKAIAKVKIAQAQLKMDDDVYRQLLQDLTGKNSAAQLDLHELDKVLRQMERLGFQGRQHFVRKAPIHFAQNTTLLKKIAALLATAKKEWVYADGIAKKMFGKDKVSHCSAEQMQKIIAALNYHIKRQT